MDDEISPARLWGWICAFVGIVMVIGIGSWWFSTATSGVRGAAAVTRQNNSAENRIQAQDAFNKLWGDIKTYDGNVQTDAKIVAEDGVTGRDSSWDKSVLSADEQICHKAVGDYNADTQDMTMKDWRPSADPTFIDSSADKTCEVRP